MTIPQEPPATEPETADKTALLVTFLKDRDAFCPACKYNLRNLSAPQSDWLQTVPRCPECGRVIELTVGLSEPFMMAWILTTAFVAMAAGIGLIFIFGTLAHGPPPFREMPALVIIDMVYALLAIPLTIALIATRRRFLKLAPGVQMTAAAIAFGINGCLLVGTFVFVR